MRNFNVSRPGGKASAVAHIYQRTKEGFLLFYSDVDFLVFFSVFCLAAKRNNIRVFGVCPMRDHLHSAVAAESRSDVSNFVRDYGSDYSRIMNAWTKTDCPFSLETFGCAIKRGDKKIRTTFSYVYNNPGEKGLCRQAEDYRWTFLAYAASSNPFSEPIKLRNASIHLRRAIKMTDYYVNHAMPLNHQWLNKSLSCLTPKERDQLIDYIIVSYNVIDYDGLLSYYGTYEQTCLAFRSNQGSEYDIKEEFSPESHKGYTDIQVSLARIGRFKTARDVLSLAEEQRKQLSRILLYESRASTTQIRKYLRLKQNSRGG